MKYIYALIDPRDRLIKYVGQSDNIDRRYEEHISKMEGTSKGKWVRELLLLGMEPEIIRIGECEDKDVFTLENWWIILGRRQGWPLTNGTRPGEWRVKDDFDKMFGDHLKEMEEEYKRSISQIESDFAVEVRTRERAEWIDRVWRLLFLLLGSFNLFNVLYAIHLAAFNTNEPSNLFMARIAMIVFWLTIYYLLFMFRFLNNATFSLGKKEKAVFNDRTTLQISFILISICLVLSGSMSFVSLVKIYA